MAAISTGIATLGLLIGGLLLLGIFTVYGFVFPYVLLDSQTISPLNGVFKFEDLKLYQGTMNSDIFAYNGQIQNQRFA